MPIIRGCLLSGSARAVPSVQDRPTSISPQRQEAVDKARQTWIRKLIDLSRRNNLLYYRALKTGTLDLSNADPARIAALLSGGEPVPISKLLPDRGDESLTSLVREIARRAQANSEEKGLETLFVAMGMATWVAEDGGRPADAPVLLLPVTLEAKGTHSFAVKQNGTLQVNLVLLQVLEAQFGISMEAEHLMSLLPEENEGEHFDPGPLYSELQKRAAGVAGFSVKQGAVLGNFAFQKMAMVKDLQQRGSELAAHDLVAAIAGDNDARNTVGAAPQELDPRELDRIPPEDEFIVLDADSSQQSAIANVLAGENAVIHGPPGTGKSQTIANLVASLAARGHRVLFVAEKRAALEVVLRRLHEIGLGHIAIDLHGADLSPKKVMQQVSESLDKVRNAASADCEQVHKQLVDRRTRLNEHVRRLHSKREPTRLSVYEMYGRLLQLGSDARTTTRWRGEELLRIQPDVAERVRDLLIEAAGFKSLFLRTDPSPWTGARLPDGPAVAHALDLASVALHAFAKFICSIHAITQQAHLRWPLSLQDARELVSLVAAVHESLTVYKSDIYLQDLPALLRDLKPGRGGGFRTAWAWLTSGVYRRARATVLALRVAGNVRSSILISELESLQGHARHWQACAESGSQPCRVVDFAVHRENCNSLFSSIALISPILPDKRIEQLTVDEVGNLLRLLVEDSSTPHEIPKLTSIENELAIAGISKLVTEIRAGNPATDIWPNLFHYSWLESTLDAISQNDPELRGFKGLTHNRYVDEFAHLDEKRITLAAERVQRAHALRAVVAMNAHPEQQRLIKAEAAKVRRHLPLRQVFAQAAEVLTAVCPCWMASPLSVSQLLDGRKQYFDFVVFDEASQVLPEDAVPSILRGKRLVVAGDNNSCLRRRSSLQAMRKIMRQTRKQGRPRGSRVCWI